MKITKYALIAILLITTITLVACNQETNNGLPENRQGTEEPSLGEDTNDYGCKPTEGYTWCPSLNECVKVWETKCPEYEEYYREPQACTMEYIPVTGEITIPYEDGERTITLKFGNRCVAEAAGATNIQLLEQTSDESVTNFEECAALGNPIMESYPEQCAHNGVIYTRKLTTEEIERFEPNEACELLSGTYIEEFDECEYISEESCTVLGGEYFPCESACRHDPDYPDVICTMQCVPVCAFN